MGWSISKKRRPLRDKQTFQGQGIEDNRVINIVQQDSDSLSEELYLQKK